MTQTVVITGHRGADDELTLVINGVAWAGWLDVRVTRGMERVPNDFQLSVTERYPSANGIDVRPGDACEIWIGSRSRPSNQVVNGYVDRYTATISADQHSIHIAGRGKCADLVDCSAEWPGSQIIANSVLEVAQALAKPFGITVTGQAGPSVGKGDKSPLIPILNLAIGESCWSIIDRLTRIAGLVAYELGDGSLLIAPNPTSTVTDAASGFTEGINVQQATAVFSQDHRYSRYRTFTMAFDPLLDVSTDGNLIAEQLDPGVSRYRPLDIVAEMGHALSYQIAQQRVRWEAARRYGRSRMALVVTDSWRDAAGELYAPNTMAQLTLPTLKVESVNWIISEVVYRKSAGSGTTCDLSLMPPQAFAVQPTLPPSGLGWDVASLPNNLAAQ